MSDRRMEAYYYDFEPTKSAAVNKILGAVACAGKAYHHTQDWCEKTSPYDDHTGVSPAEWIQNAAIEAADEIERLKKLLEQRDMFIFTNGLWPKFVGMLWEQRND